MTTLNQNIFLSVNSYVGQNHSIDFLMIIFAQYLPYIFIGLLIYLWFNDKKNEALYSGYSTTLGVGLNLTIGMFYFHPRPFMDNLGFNLLSHNPENSFPSDHTTFALSIAFMLLSFKSTRILGIITSILALSSGIARVYCGVHYLFDILGSTVVAIVSILIILKIKSKLLNINKYIIIKYNKLTGLLN